MTGWLWAAAALAAAWAVTLTIGRVRRLDRLHRRLDATRTGLAAALEMRWDVAARVAARSAERAAAGPADPVPERSGAGDQVLQAAVTAARSAGPDREPAENALGRALAAVDRSELPDGLRDALAEAELRLVLARRVHNDAVRDTLALRSRRLVRLLHLAGTAPMPAYFEIAEPAGCDGARAAHFPVDPGPDRSADVGSVLL